MQRVAGPRGLEFLIEPHAQELWDERCPHADLTTIAHAVRFSRVVGFRDGVEHGRARRSIYLFYAADCVLLVGKQEAPSPTANLFWVSTVFSVPYHPRMFGGENNPFYGGYGPYKSEWADEHAYHAWYREANAVGHAKYMQWIQRDAEAKKVIRLGMDSDFPEHKRKRKGHDDA